MFWMKTAGYGATAATGLVLGGAVGAWLNLALLWRGLRRRIGPLLDPHAWRGVARIGVGAVAAALAASAARAALEGWLQPDSTVNRALVLSAVVVAGAIPYLAIARRPAR
jgi:peptidoglycan biosynthesis protein MviN/MurJ (putative lipid II flippase)